MRSRITNNGILKLRESVAHVPAKVARLVGNGPLTMARWGRGHRIVPASYALNTDTRGFVVKTHRLLKQPNGPPDVDPTSTEGIKAAIRAYQAEVEKMKAEVENMKAQLAERKNSIAAPEPLETDIAELKAAVRAANEAIAALEAENAALEAVMQKRACPTNYPRDKFDHFLSCKLKDIRAMIQQNKKSIEKKEKLILEKEKLIQQEKQQIHQRILEIEKQIVEKEIKIEQLRQQMLQQSGQTAVAWTQVPFISCRGTDLLPAYQDAELGVVPPGAPSVVKVRITGAVFDLNLDTLHIRTAFYPATYRLLRTHIKAKKMFRLVLKGQPGIGKTVGMGTYAALRFLQDFPDGVLVVAVNNEYYLFCKESGVTRRFKVTFTPALLSARDRFCCCTTSSPRVVGLSLDLTTPW